MYNYFPHASNASSSEHLTNLLISEGHEGIGMYWMILEHLRNCDNYECSAEPRRIAFTIHTQDIEKVDRILNQYELFYTTESKKIGSRWLRTAMQAYDEKKAALRAAGARGAARRWAKQQDENDNKIATLSEQNSHPNSNITLHNITEHNITSLESMNVCQSDIVELNDKRKNMLQKATCKKNKVTNDFIEQVNSRNEAGHARTWIAQLCRDYDMSEGAFDALCECTEGALVTNITYRRLIDTVNSMRADKFRPKQTINFLLSKIIT